MFVHQATTFRHMICKDVMVPNYVFYFVFLHFSLITDTCVAMEEWVANPRSESALSYVLPCVDQRTTNQTLYKSKLVVNDIISVVNQYIYTYANTYPPKDTPYYYNQSGESMPALCYPYEGNLLDRQCTSQEVSIANASEVHPLLRAYIKLSA